MSLARGTEGSLTEAKRELRVREMAPVDGRRSTDRRAPLASHVAVDIDPRLLSPGRAHAKAWTPPTENRSERSDRRVRGRPHRSRGEEDVPRVRLSPQKGECGTPKRWQGDVITLLPRPSGGPQSPSRRPERKLGGPHREPASTGARSRVFGKQTSIGRIGVCSSGGALQGAASFGCLARRKPSPRLDENPDDGGRWREGENGAQFPPRGSINRFREGKRLAGCDACEGQDTVSGASGSTTVAL